MGLLAAAVLGYAYAATRPDTVDSGTPANGFYFLASDRADLGPRLAGYRLPSSVTQRAQCAPAAFRCGASTIDPESTATAVAASLQSYGLSSGSVTCEAGQPPMERRCSTTLQLDGEFVGAVTAVRFDQSYRAVGVQSEVTVAIGGVTG